MARAAGPAELEATLRRLLAQRGPERTVCPSEVARALGGERWRELMEPVRAVARRMADADELVVTQGGRPVDHHAARGPIRLGRPGD